MLFLQVEIGGADVHMQRQEIERDMKKYITLFLLLGALCGLRGQHLINNAAVRQQVQQDYLKRIDMLNARTEPLLRIFEEEITTEETEGLQFLLAYMPLSDLADYDGEFFLKQVRLSIAARDRFSWGKRIPEEIFRPYVLAYRVNNENLDNAREVFFQEIAPRVENLSMYEAALEVNHWCHEKVTYRPSDARTSSPLATVRTSTGRCGEESTLTVTALRAVGIPARQCYTPRWAHTDDNHAWVEVWIDGRWYFLGACEPDPELDMGWFAIPSTRTMMVHSNCFGKYAGSEETTHETDLFSRVNMLPNYTDTRKVTITVHDAAGRPVEGATVRFKLYNYAEYYPIASRKSDRNGEASITTGLGDLLIWATDGTRYGYRKIDVREATRLTITLDREAGREYVEELTIVPPAERHDVVTATPERAAANARRLQYEDSLRNAYHATFKGAADAAGIRNDNLTPTQIGELLTKAEGNHAELVRLLERNAGKRDGLYLYEFLTSLSDKDLRDFDADIIQQHITTYNPQAYPLDVYLKGILPARISNEGIRAWRNPLRKNMMSELKGNLSWPAICLWISNNITLDDEGNYYNCPISPMGVYELRRADRNSRDIFAVACCRALDIPAYIDGASGQMYVWGNGEWHAVDVVDPTASEPESHATGTLTLSYDGDGEVTPTYWTHYTIAKYENGDFVTFDYENDPRVAKFPFSLTLDAGYYMLSTGNRYSDGTTRSRLEFFNLPAGKEVKKQLTILPLVKRDVTYGTIRTDYELSRNGKQVKVSELMKDKEMLVCFIDPTREPTKHLLNEIVALRGEFEAWGGSILFMVPTSRMAADFDFKAWNLPRQSVMIEDVNDRWFNEIITSTDQYFRDNYPVVYLIQPDGTIVFKSEGYNIGTGHLILNSAK